MLRLRELRENRKITQTEFVKRLGVPRATYCSWENETRQMEYQTLIRMAVIFGVSVDYLLGRSINKTPEGKDKNDGI